MHRASWQFAFCAGCFLAGCLMGGDAAAQQATISTPFQSVSDSFYERIGVDFGFHTNNMFFNNIRPPLAPPFGGAATNADGTLGFGFSGGGGGGFLSFAAGQGSTRNFVSQTPSLTLMDGQSGIFADQALTPFVIGIVPVVGGYGYGNGGWGNDVQPPLAPPAWASKLQAGQRFTPNGSAAAAPRRNAANRPAEGKPADPWADKLAAAMQADAPPADVAEVKRQQRAARESRQQEVQDYMQRAADAVEAGKPGLARIYYQMAARRASGELKAQIAAKLEALE